MRKLAVLAIGYNRIDSIYRLLKSINNANYENDKVDLIISIDNSGTNGVEEFARKFNWAFGEKIIRTFPQRQGLRNHILACGDYLEKYDAIAILEDDVVVAPGFYSYMKRAVDKYHDNDNIAGISLYTHFWNQNIKLPFQPAYSEYDVFFAQKAQSWGQVWLKQQWFEFKKWYEQNNEELTNQDNVPSFVSKWPKTSWLKYHIKYCIEHDKYFVYPYKALATCFSDVGEHCSVQDTRLQIPMLTTIKKDYDFADLKDEDAIKYDAFYERVLPKLNFDEIQSSEICMDLYGTRTSYQNKKYVLSIKNLQYKVVQKYGLQLNPHEMNFLWNIEGETIKLYDLNVPQENRSKSDELIAFRYYFRLYCKTKLLLKFVVDTIKNKIIK